MFLLIDNYDSFTYNLYHFLGELGARLTVKRNDALTVQEAVALAPQGIILSPGPCTPNEAGICVDLIKAVAGRIPLLGVCLGHQAIGQAFGGQVIRGPVPMHGKLSQIAHRNAGVFRDLPSPFTATRYHSLAIEPGTLPRDLEVTATTVSGVIMAVRHRGLPVEAVQFHPESVLTEGGYQMLANWLAICGDDEAPARAVGMAPLMSAR
jgi:anthranilate synthase/aminodeoxychorismate synthase-like glutamine amidotransferase